MTNLFVKADDGRILAKPSVVYPHYFKILGYTGIDQGKLETARMVFTQDLMETLGAPLHIVFERDDTFKLSKFPAGGEAKAAVGSFYKSVPGTPASRLGLVAGLI